MSGDWSSDRVLFRSEVDVSKDVNAAKEMVEKSSQMGVPVIEVNGKIIVGFDKPALIKELKIKA
jgi:glutaredoxin